MIRRQFRRAGLIEAAFLPPENLFDSTTAGIQMILDAQAGIDAAAGERIFERWSV